MILRSDDIKELFLDVVRRAKKKYDFKLENFCVMENHFHLIIQPGRNVSLSAVMQWIMSVFAMAWNRRHKLTGHVWGQRFFSRIIRTLKDFLQVFEYIDSNPVRVGLVESALDWPYGGCQHRSKHNWDLLDPWSDG